jgi:hypothetical protein
MIRTAAPLADQIEAIARESDWDDRWSSATCRLARARAGMMCFGWANLRRGETQILKPIRCGVLTVVPGKTRKFGS